MRVKNVLVRFFSTIADFSMDLTGVLASLYQPVDEVKYKQLSLTSAFFGFFKMTGLFGKMGVDFIDNIDKNID